MLRRRPVRICSCRRRGSAWARWICSMTKQSPRGRPASGVPVDFQVYAGAYHGFDHIRPKARASRALVDDLIAALRRTPEAL